tara:strand:+ start:79 stop:468 length:390 start_codon:yes stop_codon:yes gene_type:complete
MSIKILFTCIVISLAALALPVSACDEESGQQTVSVEMLLQKASHADKHTIGVTNKPLSEKKAHMHTSRKGSSDCCEDGCLCFITNCQHGSASIYSSQDELAVKYSEQYEFIALSVPVSISTPPYRPPIA